MKLTSPLLFSNTGAISFKSISEWLKVLDWDLQARRPYVVIDPNDSEGLLYLSHQEYLVLLNVAMSNGQELIVLARPGSKRPESQNSPLSGVGWAGRHVRSLLANSEGMILVSGRNITSVLNVWGTTLAHYLHKNTFASTRKLVTAFGQSAKSVIEKQGLESFIKRMKISFICVNAYLSGNPLKNTFDLGTPLELRNGLPRWLPREVRAAIRSFSLPTIRIWVSILNSYKAFLGVYSRPNFKSITAPPFTDTEKIQKFQRFVRRFFEDFPQVHKGLYISGLDSLPMFSSSGPNFPISFLGRFLDIRALENASYLDKVAKVLELCKSERVLKAFEFARSASWLFPDAHRIGSLSLKFEPAGKVRVFAILDYWSQCALRPIHDFIFRVLKNFPADCTFDQEGTLISFIKKYKPVGCYSYDLSNATDMIPIDIQESVLAELVDPELAEAWKALLQRPFHYPKSSQKGFRFSKTETISYTRGQPMGALSSWAMLALTHHLLVQYAAYRVYEKRLFFEKYLVLGDDIVIAHGLVASEYLKVCEEFGIPVSLAKSYTSRKGFINFASQSFLGEINLSPLSLKEVTRARSISERAEVAERLIRRGWIGSIQAFRTFFTPQMWSKEVVFLSKGLISPLGSKYLSVMLSRKTTPFDLGTWLVSLDTKLRGFMSNMSIYTTRYLDECQNIDLDQFAMNMILDPDSCTNPIARGITYISQAGLQEVYSWNPLYKKMSENPLPDTLETYLGMLEDKIIEKFAVFPLWASQPGDPWKSTHELILAATLQYALKDLAVERLPKVNQWASELHLREGEPPMEFLQRFLELYSSLPPPERRTEVKSMIKASALMKRPKLDQYPRSLGLLAKFISEVTRVNATSTLSRFIPKEKDLNPSVGDSITN